MLMQAFKTAWEKSFGGVGKKALKGRFKRLWSSVKHLGKGTIANLGQLFSGGILTANLKKINQEYFDEIKQIDSKYGAAIKAVDDDFFKNASPLYVYAFFSNPTLLSGLFAGKKIAGKIADKSLISNLSTGSEGLRVPVENYLKEIKGEIENTKRASSLKDLGIDDKKFDETEVDNIVSTVKNQKLSSIESKIRREKERLVSAGVKDASVLKSYDMLLDELRKT